MSYQPHSTAPDSNGTDVEHTAQQINAILSQHCYIADCYIAKHPEQTQLVAWLALTSEGIETLRETGQRALISVLQQHLNQHQVRLEMPQFCYFNDKLPRNSQGQIEQQDFHQVCLNPQIDPIWLQQQQDLHSYNAQGKVPLDLIYLKDHFANFPLVPGVVELQWISDKIHSFFNKSVHIQRVDKLKYQRFLRPNDQFALSLKWDQDKKRMVFQLTVENETCCSGFAIISDEE